MAHQIFHPTSLSTSHISPNAGDYSITIHYQILLVIRAILFTPHPFYIAHGVSCPAAISRTRCHIIHLQPHRRRSFIHYTPIISNLPYHSTAPPTGTAAVSSKSTLVAATPTSRSILSKHLHRAACRHLSSASLMFFFNTRYLPNT